MKVLVVDDFSTMRKIIKNLLKQIGHSNIVEAENGREALALAEKGNFDLIVTDWNMPEMDGYDLLKSIRMNDKLCATPVIMVTAEAKKEQIVMAAKAGVNGYIIKPFTANQIKEKIEKVFKRIGN